MLNFKKIAVTGGLSSGKSTVCQLLKELGAYTISADEIVHQLLSPQTTTGQQVINLLGDEIISNNQIDRTKIAKKVFKDREKLKALERILHPAVYREIRERYSQTPHTYNLFVAEIPLLYESEGHHFFDYVIAVNADKQIALRRFQTKTRQSTEDFLMRMKEQLPPEEKSAKADFTITNNGSFTELKNQVELLYNTLTQLG